MTSTMSVQASGRFGLTNKMLGLIVSGFAVIEAVVAYFLVFAPFYIAPVYQKCAEYNAEGVTCTVTLFGKTLASKTDIANYQVILSLWDAILNIAIIYVLFTGLTLVLGFCMYKGMSFAKSYLIAMFGAKHIIGMATLLVPFAKMRRDTMIFGIIDAVVCIALCLLFVLVNNDEYVDDMLFTDEQIQKLNKRMKFGFILYGIFFAFTILTKFAMNAYGNYWSLYLGWTGNSALGQGYTLIILLAVALVASIMYIREAEWAMYFYAAFGGAIAVTNIVGIVSRILWVVKTYMPLKAVYASGDTTHESWDAAASLIEGGGGMTSGWWAATVTLVLAFLASAAIAFLSFKKIAKKLIVKFDAQNKKPALAVLISAGSIVLNFILTVAAITVWHKELYAGYSMGAMDYMYFFVYGGITLFLAIAMLGGYSFTKLGTLGLYLLIASNNFISIFSVLGQRAAKVATIEGYVGYNYIITAVLFILSILSCGIIILSFVVKGVNDYMYEKRFS